MNNLVTKNDNKTYFKLKNLINRQERVISSILTKHRSIINEKNKIIENQYMIICEQSKSIENLLQELDKANKEKNFIRRFKSLFKLKEPAISF